MRKIGLVCVLMLAAGCTYIKPSDTVLIDNHLGNAQAINKLVQADASVSPALKQWIQADTASWTWFSDIAHRRTPSMMPTGVK